MERITYSLLDKTLTAPDVIVCNADNDTIELAIDSTGTIYETWEKRCDLAMADGTTDILGFSPAVTDVIAVFTLTSAHLKKGALVINPYVQDNGARKGFPKKSVQVVSQLGHDIATATVQIIINDYIDDRLAVKSVTVETLDPSAEASVGVNVESDGTSYIFSIPQGIQGIQGIQGTQGVKGDKGDKGDQGNQGIQGIQGLKGDKGDNLIVKGVYASTSALTAAYPTGDTGTYVVTADGGWYYWSGSAWAKGGTYQSTGMANLSVTRDKYALESIGVNQIDIAQTTGKNLFNNNNVIVGYQLASWSVYQLVSNASYSVSDYIKVEPNTAYKRVRGYANAFYDASLNFISGVVGTTFTTPSTCSYMRFEIANSVMDTEQLELGSVSTTFEPYKFSMPRFALGLLNDYDKYPFQPQAKFSSLTVEINIRNAVKKIEVYGADLTKNYCLGIIQKNFSTFGTGAYIYECNTDGTTSKIVSVTNIVDYAIPTGVDVFTLAQNAGSNITAKIWVDWSYIPNATQYGNLNYNLSGLDIKTLMLPVEDITISLPSVINATIGDTLELFYKGIVKVNDKSNYNINLSATKGKKYRNRWIYTPIAGDTDFNLTVSILDNSNRLIDSKTTIVKVSTVKTSPVSTQNILCVGDSLTEGGEWVTEFDRRLTGTVGTPIGHGLSNIDFIGTMGTTTKYEGRGGWRWTHYTSNTVGNPFWNSALGRNDFSNYCTANGFTGIDYCYVLLGWNSYFEDVSTIVTQAKVFVDRLHTDFPSCKVIVSGLQVPDLDGYGENYGTESALNWFENMQFVMRLNEAYENWTKEVAYSDFMEFIHLSSQFDSENNVQTSTRTVNVRSTKTEVYGINAVHPSFDGQMQIADSAYRKFMAI